MLTDNTSSSQRFLEPILFPACSLCRDSFLRRCPALPCCNAATVVILNQYLDLLEPSDSDKEVFAVQGEYAVLIYMALSVTLQDCQGTVHGLEQAATGNLWS